MYLKVHLPREGCRKMALQFNRQYAHKNVSVSKSYVYSLIKEHGYEIVKMRSEIKHRVPNAMPKNVQWSMDLTTINKQQVFGVIDSGSRALLALQYLPNKSIITLIRTLLDIIELYGKPKSIKSDNEIVFISKLMKATLWLLRKRGQVIVIVLLLFLILLASKYNINF